jgi:hypothetical protein
MGSTTISFVKCLKMMSEQIFQHLNIVFNVTYYIGKNNKPSVTFQDYVSNNTQDY